MLAHRPEIETRYRLSRMTGQHLACWRHIERAATPAADTRLRQPRVIIRYNRIDHDLAMMTAAQFLDRLGRSRDLRGPRHQSSAIAQSPTVILDMRELDAAGAELNRQRDHVGDTVDICAVYHDIDREWDFQSHHVGGERTLAPECAVITCDAV